MPSPPRHRVLLVDDDVAVLAAFERALRHEAYERILACGATEALERLAGHPIDVVVSDEHMPEMSGTALLAVVRASYPETVRVLLTGGASLEVAIRAINEGAVYRFLTKPCPPAELALTIRQALQQHDLVCASRQLLRTVRRQSLLLEDLQRKWHGLTHVERDATGAIVVDEPPEDLDALVRELELTLDATDRRLASPR
jgi:two-component system probable response regulator PhcQ